MYKSKYNYIYKRKNDWCFYNTLTGAICLLDETYKKMYDEFNFKNQNEVLNSMIKNGFIRHNEYDEESIVNFSRARHCLNDNSMYLRILTTTSCNARCRYCYEKGMKKQSMTLEVAEQISKFILKQPRKEKIYIHWFGGEPLLNIKVIDKVMNDIYDHLKNCANLKNINVYNMLEPNIYLINKGLLSPKDGMDLKYKSGSCYACHQGSFVINPKGELFKCTVAINDPKAKVGDVYKGIDRNKTYFKWITPILPKKCNKCKFLPICQGGCRAGHMGYMNVACKRNVSEIKNILNYRIGIK